MKTFAAPKEFKADRLPRQLKGLLIRNRDFTAVSFVSRATIQVIKFLHQPRGLEGDLSIGNILVSTFWHEFSQSCNSSVCYDCADVFG